MMEKLEKHMDKLCFRLTVIFCCFLPFIVYPHITQIPYSTENTFAYRYTIDVFEYYKFVFLVFISTLMLVILIIKNFYFKEPIFISNPFYFFFLLVCISTTFSLDPAISLIGLGTKWQGLVTHLCYIISFTFIFNTFKSENTEKIVYYLLASSGIIAIISLLNYYGIDLYLLALKLKGITYNSDQIKAPIGNRISSGAYFSLTFPLGMFMLFKNSTKKVFLYFLIFINILNIAALFASQSRTAWIGTFIGILIISAYQYKKLLQYKKTLVTIISFFIVIFFILNFTGQNKISQRFSDLKNETLRVIETGNFSKFGSMRIFDYTRAFIAISERPLTGTGPDCFLFYGILTPKDKEEHPEWSHTSIITKAHSEYLEIASTIGIPALLMYLIFLFSILFRFIKYNHKKTTLDIAIFAALTCYLVQATANIGVISVLPIFFTLLAILSNRNFDQDNNDRFLYTIK